MTIWGQTLPELKARFAALDKSPRSDSLRVELLMDMARSYASISLDSTEQCANEALKISKRIGYVAGQARAVMGKANIALARGRADDAREGYDEALTLYIQSKQLLGQARCLANLGYIASLQKRSQEAIDIYLHAMEIHKKLDSTSIDMCITYSNLAEEYIRDTSKLSYAEETFKRASEIAEKKDYTHMRIVVYLGLGNCYKLQGKTVEALGISLKALQLARENQDKHGVATAYTNLSDIYIAKKEYDKAMQYIAEAESTFVQVDDQISLQPVYQKHGDILMAQEKYEEALEIYKRILPMVKRMEVPEDIKQVYNNIAKAYTALGDLSKAAQYEAKAKEVGL